MPRFFQSSEKAENGVFEIFGEDAKHISFSLRMRPGEHLTICDGAGTDHECEIIFMDGQCVRLSVLSSHPTETEPPVAIRLYQSVPKGDKFEYMRTKFGSTFPETINHFQNDDGYDVFVPIKLKE